MPPEDQAAAPAPVEDQPDTEAPSPVEETSADTKDEAPEFFEENFDPSSLPEDLQPAYKQMQGAFTKKTQSLAEQRKEFEAAGLSPEWIKDFQSPETKDQALAWLLEQNGYELPEDQDEETEDYDDENFDEENVVRDPRVDELLQRQEQQEMEALVGDMHDHIEQLAKDKDLSLTDRQRQAILREAYEAGATPDTTEKVFNDWAQDLDGWKDKLIKDYRSSKKQAPDPPQPGGSPGTTPVPPANRSERLEVANAIAQRAFDTHDQ